jgi:predicted nucleic acid-binding protein
VIGVDTGFFFALREGDERAIQIFRQSEIAISVLTLFELRRIALRQGIGWKDFGAPLSRIAALAEISPEAADRAAFVSHNAKVPAIDALIIASLEAMGCKTIYTRDPHFLNCRRKDFEIILLN